MSTEQTVAAARRVVASYPTYDQAQTAVDHLSDEGFAVDRLAIVGSELRLVEQVTGRLDYPRAALAGAASGAPLGLLFGLIWSLFLPTGASILATIAYWLFAGGVAGALAGVLSHAMNRGRRDFTSVSSVEADRYDVMAPDDLADDALSLLSRAGITPHWPTGARTG